jgi:hypothetical protein
MATKHRDHGEAMWETFWMVFHGQTRLVTFRNIRALGFTAREAVEFIHDCEREPNG